MLQRATRLARVAGPSQCPKPYLHRTTRALQIQATPSTPSLEPTRTTTASLEVLSSPSSSPSLLHVTLPPSTPLHTRRGTLVALHGASPDHTVSTLSPLSPLLRGPLGIPFLYQRITSASPVRILLASRNPSTSFCVVSLDGTKDWTIAQRNALVAWTGPSLSPSPAINSSFGIANLGHTILTGRGLVALAARAGAYAVALGPGEQFVAAPGHVLAYTREANKPSPYRLASTTLRLSVPSLASFLPDTKFIREMRKTAAARFLAQALFRLRTWSRRTFWGDRLLVRFIGPGTVVLQGRGASVADVLGEREVNEVMDSRSGSVQDGIEEAARRQREEEQRARDLERGVAPRKAPKLSTAKVEGGKVTFG